MPLRSLLYLRRRGKTMKETDFWDALLEYTILSALHRSPGGFSGDPIVDTLCRLADTDKRL